MLTAASIVLAQQHGGHEASESGQLVYTIMILAVLAFVWIALGVTCWIFWQAKKREDAARKELEWRNAPSS